MHTKANNLLSCRKEGKSEDMSEDMSEEKSDVMLEDIVRRGLTAWGLREPEGFAAKLRIYYEFLIRKNAVMNLTAITGEADAARLHFLDSLACIRFTDFQGKSAVDIGTGAGFPGLVLKLYEPSLDLTLLDAQRKRLDFLRELLDKLQLEGVELRHGRAEEADWARERFDIVLARAVARLPVLCELCLPYVAQGGVFLAMKGPEGTEELGEASRAIGLLGGAAEQTEIYTLPDTDIHRSLIRIRKIEKTPSRYPRRYSAIVKSPL